LGVIKRELEENERIKADFGDFVGETWTDKAIVVKNRDFRLKDPTVEVVGVLGSITGGHFDLIVCDDILDNENTKIATRRQETYDWFFGTILPLLEPDGQEIVVGTRKHYDDLYGHLIHNPLWVSDIESAFIRWPKDYHYIYNEEGKALDVKIVGESQVLWAGRWDAEKLLLTKLNMGTPLFLQEFENNAEARKGQVLKLEWLDIVEADQIPSRDELEIYQGVDLATSEKEEADFTVIATVGVDSSNQIWLLDIDRFRLSFPKVVKRIEESSKEWKSVVINIESQAYQIAAYQQLFETTMLPVRASKTTKDKRSRFLAMAVNLENGRVKISAKVTDEFIKEWVEFPTSAHDDTLDAVEKALEVALQGGLQIF